MVTAPPPAFPSGRRSKTVTSCPSRNNPRAMEMPPTPAPTTRIRSARLDDALGTGIRFAELTSVLCVPFISPPLKSRLEFQQAKSSERHAPAKVERQQRIHLETSYCYHAGLRRKVHPRQQLGFGRQQRYPPLYRSNS